jgi:hypothetical protein
MPSLFKTVGAVLCLAFALCFVAPNAHADSFTYTFTSIDKSIGCSVDPSNCGSYSWTTEAIPAVTSETTLTAAQLTSTTLVGALAGCSFSSIILDLNGLGAQSGFTSCAGFQNNDGFSLADYGTSGTYTATLIKRTDTLVVTKVQTPEPSSLALMLSGVGLVFGMRKRWWAGLRQAS